MSATKSLAFVLHTQDYRDTSLLGDFYTKDFGRIRGIVKGIRDTRARFGSTLEPFSLNEILFYRRRRGAELHLVTQVDLLDLFPVLRDDLERLATASYCSELLKELVENEESAPEIFELMHDTLKFLVSGASAKRAARIFEVKLFDLLGLMPEVKNCVFCRTEAKGIFYFNAGLGGVHCGDCGSKGKLGARHVAASANPRFSAGQGSGRHETSAPISLGTLHFLSHVQRAAISDLYSVKVSQEVGEELEKVLRRFTDFHLSHKLNSLTFMEKIGL